MKVKTFESRKDCQLIINFPDGSKVSSIWGFGSYSDNHMMDIEKAKKNIAEHSFVGTWFNEPIQSNTIEVMYTCVDEKKQKKINKKFGEDNPLGYLKFDEWLWLINLLK